MISRSILQASRTAIKSTGYTRSIHRQLVHSSASLRPLSLPQPLRASFATAAKVPPKMRAILIKDGKGPADNLYMGEEATPEPKKGEVQVKVSLYQ